MIIQELRKHFPARAPEWVNAFVLVAWGAYVILHPELFDQPAFAGLHKVLLIPAPAAAYWGILAMSVGWLRACALFVNGAYYRTPLVRLIASLFSAFVWSQIVIGLWVNEVPNFGLVMYSGAVVMDMVAAYHASCDITIAEAARRAHKVGEVKRGKLSERRTDRLEQRAVTGC